MEKLFVLVSSFFKTEPSFHVKIGADLGGEFKSEKELYKSLTEVSKGVWNPAPTFSHFDAS